MWIVFAFGSAVFAGLTAILAKCGIRRTDSTVATALRTVVVLIFAWGMVFLTGAQTSLSAIDSRSLWFLVLSGLSTGASWLCYFKALQLGDVNKVTPIDKSSTVLTVLLAALLLGEPMTVFSAAGIAAIAAGTLLMIAPKPSENRQTRREWLCFAVLSAVFAALTAILSKIGICGVDSNLGTAIRTGVVLVMAWTVVFVCKKGGALRNIPGREAGFIILSGLATGASWLCYYKALQSGPASVVVPIDKLSVVFTVAFSGLVLKEKCSAKALWGLALIVAGTLVMLIR